MEQQDGGRTLRPSFTIKDVEPVYFDGLVKGGIWFRLYSCFHWLLGATPNQEQAERDHRNACQADLS